MIAVNVEARKLLTTLDAYPRILGVEIGDAMRFSFRRMIQRVIAWTPPHNGRGGNTDAALKVGEAAIRRDILRLVFIERREVLDFWQEQNDGKPHISSLTLNKKGTRQPYTLTNLRIDPEGRELASVHRSARTRRGTIPRRYRGTRLAVTPEAFSRFLGQQQAHSGIAKGGWVPAFAHFGGMSPAWIARHGGAGSFVDTMVNHLFTLEATNRAKSIGSLEQRLIASSIRAEARATMKELERAIDSAGYRTKLISKIS